MANTISCAKGKMQSPLHSSFLVLCLLNKQAREFSHSLANLALMLSPMASEPFLVPNFLTCLICFAMLTLNPADGARARAHHHTIRGHQAIFHALHTAQQ